ncbi:MAG: carbohydrate kinase [Candidatus Pseudobacter hemicellulosilyticus]|uniref:Carbohydrate kinase n=1 Tax=Candidatus Pseudobacter hemicellulosilyticus TaxID=3121375 RepID=A0AAJ5WUS2_9BACT|nr:MAG: carbohydrate kinase [Pseudobacter sp.]
MTPQSFAPVACFGEILWDLLPSGRRLGGAPFNVCYHLGQLGLPARMISCLGDDPSGADVRALLAEQQLPASYVQTVQHAPTGYVFATEVAPQEMQYEIVEDVAWDEIGITPEAIQLVDSAPYFVFGSLVARGATSRATLFALLEAAQRPVFDVNLRPPFYSEPLIHSLLEKTSILKINENELTILADWFGLKGSTGQQLEALASRYSLEEILLTRGAHGAMAWKEGQHWSCEGIPTKVADTVGSGDAFLAAYLTSSTAGAPIPQRLEAANRLAAWVTQWHGGCPPYDDHVLHRFKLSIIKT